MGIDWFNWNYYNELIWIFHPYRATKKNFSQGSHRPKSHLLFKKRYYKSYLLIINDKFATGKCSVEKTVAQLKCPG
jgi:hypothetical protein